MTKLMELFENEYLEHSYRWFPKMDWVYDYSKQIIEHLESIDAVNYVVEISSDNSLVVYIRIDDQVLFIITKYFNSESDKNLNVNHSVFFEKELFAYHVQDISLCTESIKSYINIMTEEESR
jgi:hypothetical protein